MKTRLLPLSLALTALLALPAGAFSDVPENAWYADAAQLCVDRGLLKGTWEDTFSPDNAVTLAEVMTVAVRLHYQAHGGTGDPPAAPDNWGTGALSTPSGATLLTFNTCDLDRGLTYRYDQESPRRLHLYLTVTAEERAALTPAGGRSPHLVHPRASLLYMVRSNHVAEAVELQKRVDKIAQGAALMTEATVEKTFIDGLADTVTNRWRCPKSS